MANIKNLLKESIIDVKRLKEASAQTTKDMLLSQITEDVKRKLYQDNYQDQQEVFTEQWDNDIQDIMEQSDQELLDDDQIMQQVQEQDLQMMDEQEIDDLIEQLQNNIMQEEQEMVHESQIESIIAQLQNDIIQEQDDMIDDDTIQQSQIDSLISQLQGQIQEQQSAYTEDVMNQQFPQDDDDQEILERIRQIIQSDQDIQLEESDELERLKAQNRQLRNYHRQVSRHISQTKNIKLRGQYAKKVFDRYQLTENQKVRILQNFDRASSQRQIKLVYTTLMQGFMIKNTNKQTSRRNFASNRTGSTRSRISQNLEYKDIDQSVQNVRQIFQRKVGL